MTTTWQPDTCVCILEYEGTDIPANFIKYLQRCDLHKSLTGTTLETAVRSQNTSINAITDLMAKQEDKDARKILEKNLTKVV